MVGRITTRQTFVDAVDQARRRGLVMERSFVLDDILYQSYMSKSGKRGRVYHIGHITYDIFGDERMSYYVHVEDEVIK